MSPPSEGPALGADASGPHLTVAELHEYRAHRLRPEEETRIQEHLAECDECRELAVDVSAFFDPEESGEETVPVDRVASWSRLEASLTQEGWFEGRRKQRQQRWSGVLKVAAAVIALFVAGSVRFVFGYGGGEATLVSLGAFKGGAEERAVVQLPVLLKLTLAGHDGSGTYRADLLDERGARVKSYDGLRTEEDGRLRLRLRRWQVKPGLYRLEVRDANDRGGPVDEYELEIRPR